MLTTLIDIAGEVHVSADGHQLPEFEAPGHTSGVADAESHEDHGHRDHGFGGIGGRRREFAQRF